MVLFGRHYTFSHLCPTNEQVHDLSGVGSVGITMEGEIDDVVFNEFMQLLLQAKARDIYRWVWKSSEMLMELCHTTLLVQLSHACLQGCMNVSSRVYTFDIYYCF